MNIFKHIQSPPARIDRVVRRGFAISLGWVAMALLVAGCATTRVDVLWSNPDFAARKVEGKILVVGLTRDQAMRRVYEDELVAQFGQRGIAAMRSYEVIQGVFGADGTKTILDAARREGAVAVLSSAVVGHEHVTRVIVDEPPAQWYGMYEGWYRYYWPHLYRRAEVQVTERYLAGTTLIDVASGKIRWSARTHTDAGGNVERDIKDFASVVIETLGKNGML
jgi:hypothetical protein